MIMLNKIISLALSLSFIVQNYLPMFIFFVKYDVKVYIVLTKLSTLNMIGR